MGSWTWVKCVQASEYSETLLQGRRIRVTESGEEICGFLSWVLSGKTKPSSIVNWRGKVIFFKNVTMWYHIVFPLIWQREVVCQWEVWAVSLYSPKPFPSVFHPAWIQLELSALCPGASFLSVFRHWEIVGNCISWKGINPSLLSLLLEDSLSSSVPYFGNSLLFSLSPCWLSYNWLHLFYVFPDHDELPLSAST